MEIYLGILGCFPQAMLILNVINWTNIPFINSGEYYSIIRLACKEKKKRWSVMLYRVRIGFSSLQPIISVCYSNLFSSCCVFPCSCTWTTHKGCNPVEKRATVHTVLPRPLSRLFLQCLHDLRIKINKKKKRSNKKWNLYFQWKISRRVGKYLIVHNMHACLTRSQLVFR